MKVYIAGPMSGIPKFNIPAFDEAARVLRGRGFEVVSPAEVDGPVTREQLLTSENGDHADLPKDEGWSFYLSRDFRILADGGIDVIAVLPGWEKSRGARLEVLVGKELGIESIPLASLVLLQDTFGPMERQPEDHEPIPEDELYDDDGHFIRDADNPLRQRSVTGGVKDNRGKAPIDLLPSRPLVAAAEIMAFGADKYKPHNWRLGLSWSQTWSSLQRHLLAFNDGEELDPETGKSHLAHAMCQLMFLTEYSLTGTGTDDRWVSVDREGARA
jgi:hypothetical protein